METSESVLNIIKKNVYNYIVDNNKKVSVVLLPTDMFNTFINQEKKREGNFITISYDLKMPYRATIDGVDVISTLGVNDIEIY